MYNRIGILWWKIVGIKLFSCENDFSCKKRFSDYHEDVFESSFKEIKDEQKKYKYKSNPNPIPYYFEIVELIQVGKHVVALIKYPNCTTYGGKKLSIYRNITIEKIKEMKSLDPHFLESDELTPFARFEPTDEGAIAAHRLAQILM